MTDSMKRAIDETNRRREIQKDYNERNGITPQSIIKPIDMNLVHLAEADYVTIPLEEEQPDEVDLLTADQREKHLADIEQKMREAAKNFEFEKAAQLRDRLKALRSKFIDVQGTTDSTDR
jgi:excinuclease ABC subunit B